MKPGVFVLALVAVLLAVPGGCGMPVSEQPGTESDSGEEFHFTAVEMFSGKTVNFPDDFEGRVIYVNFFFDG